VSVSSNSLVIATQPNAKGISHGYQVNLTVHKVSSVSVAHCVMISRTLHCVKYYTNILTNSRDCNQSGKINSISYHVHSTCDLCHVTHHFSPIMWAYFAKPSVAMSMWCRSKSCITNTKWDRMWEQVVVG